MAHHTDLAFERDRCPEIDRLRPSRPDRWASMELSEIAHRAYEIRRSGAASHVGIDSVVRAASEVDRSRRTWSRSPTAVRVSRLPRWAQDLIHEMAANTDAERAQEVLMLREQVAALRQIIKDSRDGKEDHQG